MSLTFKKSDIIIAFDTTTDKKIYYEKDPSGYIAYDAYGDFKIIPKKDFEFLFIVGPSGSGKSYFASNYSLEYRRMFHDRPIIMFSQKTNDPAYDVHKGKDISKRLNIKRYLVDDDILSANFDITKDFRNCLLIFDDFLYYSNKKIIEKVVNLIEQILCLGRQNNIHCVITAHLCYQLGGNQSLYSNIQNEIHKLVFFHNGKNCQQLTRVLKSYWGFEPKMIRNIFAHDHSSRWVCVNRSPQCIISEHHIKLFD